MKFTIPENFYFKHPLDKPARWKWHRWFAWHPTYTLDGVWVWLLVVERRMEPATNWDGDNWGYATRLVGSKAFPDARTQSQFEEDRQT